jgi:predicted NBD/HSP70 family sugar kinase
VVRHVGRSNAGGFQELAGGKQVLALARSLGIRASSPHAAVAKALTVPGAGDLLLGRLGERLALGLAALVSVIDPSLVVLAGAVAAAGGERLRDVVRSELAELAVPRPAVVLTAVPEQPVLTGALHTALAGTRDHVFDTLQSTTPVSVTT